MVVQCSVVNLETMHTQQHGSIGYTYTYFCIHTLTYIHVTKAIEEKEAITLKAGDAWRSSREGNWKGLKGGNEWGKVMHF